MYYEVTVAGHAPKYVAARLEHRGGQLAQVRRPRDGQAEVVVARLGRRHAGQPADLPSGQPRHAGTRRRWPRTGTAAPGACNTYSYRFTDVSLAQSSGGVWRPLQLSSEFQDPGYHVVPISNTPAQLPRSEPRRVGRCAGGCYVIVSGDPTFISRASFRIWLFTTRMQPCEMWPGIRPGSFVPWTPMKPPPGQSVSTAERALVPNASGP